MDRGEARGPPRQEMGGERPFAPGARSAGRRRHGQQGRHDELGGEAMKRERLYLFDTTLRDGQQTPGVDFSLDDKLVVMEMLDGLGLDYIEGGYAGANRAG